jgi:hypothetical protein
MKRERDSAERGQSRRAAVPTVPPSTLPPDVVQAFQIVASAIHKQMRRKHDRPTRRKPMARAGLRLVKPKSA